VPHIPLPRVTLPAVAIAATAALVMAFAPAASASTVNYVALGDSYSSGVGAGNYISSSGSCDRSTNAYPQLWANANDPASFAFVACSGATTSDVISSQLSALSGSTTLVSITIGGNDVGFSSVMETCVLGSTSDCVNAIDAAEAKLPALSSSLENLYSDINADAPNAHVVVLGYPEFYDLANSWFCPGLSTTDRTDLNQAADELDSTIQNAAQAMGETYADVRSAFSGHEICDSDSWLNSVDWFDISSSYHPTASGQADAYDPVFSSAAG
jgi:lysophospholipase L1-like esterase